MIPGVEKRCVTCGEHKPMDAFAKNRSRPDGLQSRCRDCTRAYYRQNAERIKSRARAYRDEDPEAARARSAAWREANREKARATQRESYRRRADYYRDRARTYYAENRDAAAATSRAWTERNREKVRVVKSRYKHKRRALEKASTLRVTSSDMARAFNRVRSCVYCGRPFDSFKDATWDHVIPVTRGGSFGIGNLVPACGSCNSSKNNKTVMEWRVWKARHLTVL